MKDHSSLAQDPMFDPDESNPIGNASQPAFRLTAYLPFEESYPGKHLQAYEDLFEPFREIMQTRCSRIYMWDRPGAKARRSEKIRPTDLTPFTHMMSVYNSPDGGIFAGFQFIDRDDEKENPGRGPTGAYFFMGMATVLDFSISVADWDSGALKIGAVLDAIQRLPYISFTAGFGLTHGFSRRQGSFLELLMPVHEKYPVLDLMSVDQRERFWDDPHEIGICGINWLTGVSHRFLEPVGGGEALGATLPLEIKQHHGPNGSVFQLGQHPITGEAGVDDGDLPLYHALGAALRHVWMPTEEFHWHTIFDYRSGENAKTLAYARRFYEPYQP